MNKWKEKWIMVPRAQTLQSTKLLIKKTRPMNFSTLLTVKINKNLKYSFFCLKIRINLIAKWEIHTKMCLFSPPKSKSFSQFSFQLFLKISSQKNINQKYQAYILYIDLCWILKLPFFLSLFLSLFHNIWLYVGAYVEWIILNIIIIIFIDYPWRIYILMEYLRISKSLVLMH